MSPGPSSPGLEEIGFSDASRRTSTWLRIDPAARRVWISDREVALTSREFSVSEYLVRQVDRVVSKRRILENVWDFAFGGDPNIVEVYIRRLRSKLGLPSDQVNIVTVRGAAG